MLERSFERDIIPMARAEGLALAPWDVLGGGKIRTDAEEARRRETGEKGRTLYGPNWERTEEERKVCLVLEQVAKEVGTESITASELPFLGRVRVGQAEQSLTSCDRVPPSKDAVCVPSSRRPEGRVSPAEYQGAGNIPFSRTNPTHRGRKPYRSWLPLQCHCAYSLSYNSLARALIL